MVSLHDLSKALLPLAHLVACSNATLSMCTGSWEPGHRQYQHVQLLQMQPTEG